MLADAIWPDISLSGQRLGARRREWRIPKGSSAACVCVIQVFVVPVIVADLVFPQMKEWIRIDDIIDDKFPLILNGVTWKAGFYHCDDNKYLHLEIYTPQTLL